MAELSFSEVFGTGATRLTSGETVPSSGLFIPDSLLSTFGLDSPSTATADGHLAAILIGIQSNLTQEAFDANIDRSIYTEPGFSQFIPRGENNDSYRIDGITVYFAKLDANAILDPNDY